MPIQNKKILIVAEAGHSHNGNIKLAKQMIWEAKACGADIIKFQVYDVNVIKKPWQSRYFELMMAQLSRKEVKELFNECRKAKIEFMASVFDIERVKWLESLGVKRYKIASRSIFDKPLINAIERTGKPIIASLGCWRDKNRLPDIKGQVDYLYCVSDYPAYISEDEFPIKFDKYSGFSDHTMSCYWAREAIKREAKIIEKHFTLNKTLPGYNQKGSAEPWELKDLVSYARQYEKGIQY